MKAGLKLKTGALGQNRQLLGTFFKRDLYSMWSWTNRYMHHLSLTFLRFIPPSVPPSHLSSQVVWRTRSYEYLSALPGCLTGVWGRLGAPLRSPALSLVHECHLYLRKPLEFTNTLSGAWGEGAKGNVRRADKGENFRFLSSLSIWSSTDIKGWRHQFLTFTQCVCLCFWCFCSVTVSWKRYFGIR